MIRRMERNRRY